MKSPRTSTWVIAGLLGVIVVLLGVVFDGRRLQVGEGQLPAVCAPPLPPVVDSRLPTAPRLWETEEKFTGCFDLKALLVAFAYVDANSGTAHPGEVEALRLWNKN